MGDAILNIILRARDEASEVMGNVGKQVEKTRSNVQDMGKAFVVAGGMMTAGGLAGVAVLKDWIDAASESEVQMAKFEAKMASTFGNAPSLFRSVRDSALDTAKAFVKLGFDDEATANSFVSLASKTKDAAKAQEYMALAADMARAKGIALADATEQITKILMGKGNRALLEYGIVAEKGGSATEYLAQIQRKVAGQAEAYANTAIGANERLKITFENLREELGGKLVPVITRVLTVFLNLIDRLNGINPDLLANVGVVVALASAFMLVVGPMLTFVGLLATVGPMLKAFFTSALLIKGILIATGATAVFAGALYILYNRFKSVGEAVDYVQGKLNPYIDRLQYIGERTKQILSGFGISGEFGGVINFFAMLYDRTVWYSERLGQIIQGVKNFLAFGMDAGQGASWLDALDGIWNRMKEFMSYMAPLFDQMRANFALFGQVIQTQVAPAFAALVEVMGPFVQATLPILQALLMVVIFLFAELLVYAMAFITGIMAGLANALPYIGQAIEGIIQFFRGFIQFLTGVFSLDFKLVIEGMLQMLFGLSGFFRNTFEAMLNFLSGWLKGVFAVFGAFAQYIREDLYRVVNELHDWFIGKFNSLHNKMSGITQSITGLFRSMAEGIMAALRTIKFPHLNISMGEATVAGHKIQYPKLDVAWYEKGGWVDQTGLAVVHEGEFVMSRSMLEGSTPVPSSVVNNNQPINIYATIESDVDISALGYRLAWALRNSR